MAIKSLQVLYAGTDTLDHSRITYGVPPGTMLETCFLCFLVRADEGNILIDTGPHPEDAEARIAAGAHIKVRPEDRLPNRLDEVGLSMADIDLVVMTHLDWDHCGYLSELPGAEVFIQKEEQRYSFDPPPFARHRFATHAHRFMSPGIKYHLVDGDHIIMPGLTLLFTPGHTPGHQSVLVELPRSGPIIITGDCADTQEDIEKERIPMFLDSRQGYYSQKRLKVLSQVLKAPLFTTHDLDFWRQEMRKPPEEYN